MTASPPGSLAPVVSRSSNSDCSDGFFRLVKAWVFYPASASRSGSSLRLAVLARLSAFAKQREEFREDHRSRAPDVGALHDERGHGDLAAVSPRRTPDEAFGVDEFLEGHFQDPCDLAVRCVPRRSIRRGGNDRVQA